MDNLDKAIAEVKALREHDEEMLRREKDSRRPLSSITKQEWVAIRWIEVSEVGDTERMFLDGGQRTPDEALIALDAWERTEEYYRKPVIEEGP